MSELKKIHWSEWNGHGSVFSHPSRQEMLRPQGLEIVKSLTRRRDGVESYIRVVFDRDFISMKITYELYSALENDYQFDSLHEEVKAFIERLLAAKGSAILEDNTAVSLPSQAQTDPA
jgi:hypothetical protein